MSIMYTYLLTYGAEPFWRSRQFCSYSRISQHVMEPEGSLPCSQEPSTGPYPEPYQSNPYHFSIVHPPTPWSSQWSLSFWLSHKYPIRIPRLPHSYYMPRPPHPPWLNHSNDTWRRVQVMKLLIMNGRIHKIKCVILYQNIFHLNTLGATNNMQRNNRRSVGPVILYAVRILSEKNSTGLSVCLPTISKK
jgi:hypothetical protein